MCNTCIENNSIREINHLDEGPLWLQPRTAQFRLKQMVGQPAPLRRQSGKKPVRARKRAISRPPALSVTRTSPGAGPAPSNVAHEPEENSRTVDRSACAPQSVLKGGIAAVVVESFGRIIKDGMSSDRNASVEISSLFHRARSTASPCVG